MSDKPTIAEIEAAAARLAAVTSPSPLQRSGRLSAASGLEVYLKREDLQVVRSYKLRGAYNLMAQLTEQQRACGVVGASAGNHAQGIAFAAAHLGVRARIYLPRSTPRQKRDRIVAHGQGWVELVLSGDTYDDAAAAAARYAEQAGAVPVQPFDDPRTIAGQGTIAAEILAELTMMPRAVVVPVGGGGLIAGMVTYLRERAAPVEVIGVEPAGAASMTAALAAGAPVTLDHIDPFVDGAAVRRVGDLPTRILLGSPGPPRMLTVAEGAVCTEMLQLYQQDGIVAEPAGALAVTALPQVAQLLDPGDVVVLVVSGGNNDVSRYGDVVERSLVHQGLKHYFLVEFSQTPGALRQFLDEVLGPDDDITLFEYVKRNNRETGPALVGLEIGSVDALPALLERMEASPMNIERLLPGSTAYAYLT